MNDTMTKLPAVQPAMPMEAMQQLAASIAKSRLFGITTADQALTLMSIAQAEGRHPALAARDYHIIQGTPAKKAEAMMRDFLSAGGRVEWHELSDAVAEATFSHPAGGTVRLRWDQDRVKQAELKNAMHKKYPRQMLRSRLISEGVRTVCPAATGGMYVPEEVAEFAPTQRDPIDVTPRQDLDKFAALPAAERDLVGEGREHAAQGMKALTAWYRSLSDEDYERATPLIGTRETPGELRDLARQADAKEEDAFGLPPAAPGSVAAPSQQASADNRQERPGADDADTPGAGDAHTEPTLALDDCRNPLHVPLPRDPKPERIAIYVDCMRRTLGESPSFARRAKVKLGNEDSLRRLKALDLGAYQDLMRALDGRDGP